MTIDFQGEGKYDSQWDAWDDGFTVQAEAMTGLLEDIEHLRSALASTLPWLPSDEGGGADKAYARAVATLAQTTAPAPDKAKSLEVAKP